MNNSESSLSSSPAIAFAAYAGLVASDARLESARTILEEAIEPVVADSIAKTATETTSLEQAAYAFAPRLLDLLADHAAHYSPATDVPGDAPNAADAPAPNAGSSLAPPLQPVVAGSPAETAAAQYRLAETLGPRQAYNLRDSDVAPSAPRDARPAQPRSPHPRIEPMKHRFDEDAEDDEQRRRREEQLRELAEQMRRMSAPETREGEHLV